MATNCLRIFDKRVFIGGRLYINAHLHASPTYRLRSAESPTFYSKEWGLKYLRGGVKNGYIHPEDEEATRRAILESALPNEEVVPDIDAEEDEAERMVVGLAFCGGLLKENGLSDGTGKGIADSHQDGKMKREVRRQRARQREARL